MMDGMHVWAFYLNDYITWVDHQTKMTGFFVKVRLFEILLCFPPYFWFFSIFYY
jgi:hypothetical protein